MVEPAEVKIDNDELENALAGKIGDDEQEKEQDQEDEKVEGEKKEEEKEEKKEEPSELDILKKSNEEMRQMLLEQKKQNAKLESRLNRLSRPKAVKEEPQEDDDEEEEDQKKAGKGKKSEETKSAIEVLEAEVKAIHDGKDSIFDMQLDVMSESKRFSDVLEVCSDGNINDILDAVAKQVSKDQNLDYHHASLEVEKFVWSQKNPYKYLYGLIKEYHPKYSKSSKGQDKSTEGAAEKKGKESKKAPESIAEVPGDNGAKSGWTAARIDAMDESELSKVPRDIYEKYLANELK